MKTTLSIILNVPVILTLLLNNYVFAQNHIRYVENKGQVSNQFHEPRPDVLFCVASGSLTCHFKKSGFSYQILQAEKATIHSSLPDISPIRKMHEDANTLFNFYRLDINWINSNQHVQVKKGVEQQGYDNYYLEVCPRGITNVKSFESILYQNLYEGIDVRWYSANGQMKYDYIVKAGSNYKQIKWELKGAKKVAIAANGDLIIETPLGTLIEEKPLVFQNGKQLPANWKIEGAVISFEIKNVDPTREIIIDPLVRLWGSYYGGNAADSFSHNTVDRFNNLYFSGITQSATSLNIATVGSHQSTYGGVGTSIHLGDALLVKMNASGVRQWATYYGGSGGDFAGGCSSDSNGNIYLTGCTTSTNSGVMSTSGAHQTVSNILPGQWEGDAFLVKFDGTGVRQWSTFYGDSADDWGLGVSVDLNDDVFLSGGTYGGTNSGTVFATSGCHQPTHASGNVNIDAYLAKFNSMGQRIWGTYYGGATYDEGFYCAADATGNIYLTGSTTTSAALVIATANAHQQTIGGGRDAYLAKFDANGNRLWATYYGSGFDEFIHNCSIDPFNQVVAFGASTFGSTVIATPGTHQPSYGGGNSDVFICKFTSAGVRKWGTYYGGTGYEAPGICAVSATGDIFICGHTTINSGTTIATCGAYQFTHGGGGQDYFLAKLDSTGNRRWGTFFGGAGMENQWCGVTVDGANNVYLGGTVPSITSASIISTLGAHQGTFAGGPIDIFIQKFDACFPDAPIHTSGNTACSNASVIITANQTCGLKWYSDASLTKLIYTGGSFTAGILTSDSTFYFTDEACGITSGVGVAQLTLAPSPSLSILSTAMPACRGDEVLLFAASATSFTWAGLGIQYSVAVTPSASTVYTVRGAFQNGCSSTGTIQVTIEDCVGIAKLSDKNAGCYIYPNPGRGEFNFHTNEKASLSIFDQLGRNIANEEIGAGVSEIKTALLPGIYNVVVSIKSEYSVHKLIVTH